jgi:hypothetical protein
VQHVYPLFGEYYTDQAIARGAAHRQGPTAIPAVSFTGDSVSGWKVRLAPGDLPFWAWMTRWNQEQGAFQVYEDSFIDVTVGVQPSSGKTNVLIVGRWAWAAGPIDADGVPTGEFTTAQSATYEALTGTGGDDPVISQPNGLGKYGVALLRVILDAPGSTEPPRWEWVTSSIADFKAITDMIATEAATRVSGDALLHKKSGDETHTSGFFRVAQAPVNANDVVRLGDLSAVSMGHNLALGHGTVPNGWAIPLPWFNDRIATHAECVFMVSNAELSKPQGYTYYQHCTVDYSNRVVNNYWGEDHSTEYGPVNYLIIGRR